MSERDKLIAQAEALEQYAVEWQHAADDAGIPPVHMFSAMYVAEDVREEAAKLRALADQQPVEEPHGIITASDGRVAWLKGMPPIGTNIYTRPQSSAPANFRDAYVGAREDLGVWKRRALAAEENNRQLTRALQEEVLMAEPFVDDDA